MTKKFSRRASVTQSGTGSPINRLCKELLGLAELVHELLALLELPLCLGQVRLAHLEVAPGLRLHAFEAVLHDLRVGLNPEIFLKNTFRLGKTP